MNTSFPLSVQTPTPAAGHALARQLAERALHPSASDSMAAHLRTSTTPSVELLTAAYFQAIVTANAGWRS